MKKLTFLLITSLFILQSCGGGEEQTTDESAPSDSVSNLMQVSVQEIKPTQFENYFEVQGSIEADKNVIITAETGGLIKSILVEEGQRVHKGQTLITLDSDVIAKNIAEVQKSLELATFVYDKQKSLHEQNIGSELQYQQAKNNKERLEQTLETLKSQQSMSIVSAPFDGYIEEIFPNVGEMAAPQIPLIRMLDIKKVTVVADVMETYLNTVKKGKNLDLKINAIDTSIKNVPVSLVGKYINPANRTFKIHADIDNKNERLLPNMVAIVRVKNEVLDSVFVVPSMSILQSSSGENYLYVVENISGKNKVARRNVKVRASDDNQSVISSGINKGDKVIIDGARGVKPGMEVRIKK